MAKKSKIVAKKKIAEKKIIIYNKNIKYITNGRTPKAQRVPVLRQKILQEKEKKMAIRQKTNKKKDKKIFRKTAVRTKLINNRTQTPRGGIRL